jgi:hypothetical protein
VDNPIGAGAGFIAALISVSLGIWARITFVRRSEIYAKDGKPVYRHTDDCSVMQQACNKLVCYKIEEVKAAQIAAETKRDLARGEIHGQLKDIQNFMGRVDQYMKDHL